MRYTTQSLSLLLLVLLLFSCQTEKSKIVSPIPVARAIYVVNSLGETISLIDLETDSVYNDIYTTGVTPAEIKFFDGSLFLLNSGDNTIQQINLYSGISYFAELGDNRSPAFLEFINPNTAAIANFTSGTVSFVNLSSGEVEEEIPVGKALWGMTYHQGNIYVGITNFDISSFTYGPGRVAIIDANTKILKDSLDVGTNPGILFVDQQDELNVVCTGDYYSIFGEVWRFNPQNDSLLGNFTLGGSPLDEALAENGIIYLAAGGFSEDGYLLCYNTQTETIIHGGSNPITIPNYPGIMGIVLDSEGVIYASSLNTDQVLALDENGNILKVYSVGDGPQNMVYVEM